MLTENVQKLAVAVLIGGLLCLLKTPFQGLPGKQEQVAYTVNLATIVRIRQQLQFLVLEDGFVAKGALNLPSALPVLGAHPSLKCLLAISAVLPRMLCYCACWACCGGQTI